MNSNLEKLGFWITIIATISLSMILLGMTVSVCIGLFDEKVDNAEIFKLISPAFQTIVGGFIGLLAGVKLSHGEAEEK